MLLDLPDELIIKIIGHAAFIYRHIDIPTLLSYRLVNKRFADLCLDNYVWEELVDSISVPLRPIEGSYYKSYVYVNPFRSVYTIIVNNVLDGLYYRFEDAYEHMVKEIIDDLALEYYEGLEDDINTDDDDLLLILLSDKEYDLVGYYNGDVNDDTDFDAIKDHIDSKVRSYLIEHQDNDRWYVKINDFVNTYHLNRRSVK